MPAEARRADIPTWEQAGFHVMAQQDKISDCLKDVGEKIAEVQNAMHGMNSRFQEVILKLSVEAKETSTKTTIMQAVLSAAVSFAVAYAMKGGK